VDEMLGIVSHGPIHKRNIHKKGEKVFLKAGSGCLFVRSPRRPPLELSAIRTCLCPFAQPLLDSIPCVSVSVSS
jgi:hypothetical protein